MALSTGDKLGHYEVLSLLGKGGMGEVYRARDTQLKREVALKVLPAVFSSNAESLARFKREAELLASLDHPNIGPIHGIVEADQNWALVLALIEGPTLADRIAQGPLSVEEAVAYSKQIIDAMEYAHERGVIHRDLKPANIKITPDGVVKVLDFGLAKALDERTPTSSASENASTLTMGGTRAGVIMGTAAYMSPEQAVGTAADRRADIFSFGVVLFEMLSGKRAFHGETVGHTLAAVVKDAPDWSTLPEGTPSHLRNLLERMLAKNRKQRLQAIGEARIILEAGEPVASPVQTEAAAAPRRPWAIAAAAVFAVIAAVASWIAWQASQPPELRPLVRLSVEIGSDGSQAPGTHTVISPDGQRVVYLAEGKAFTRRLDQLEATELLGTTGFYGAFFSPDGQWVGFGGGGRVQKLSVHGGTPVTLCSSAILYGASWGEDGNIIAAFASGGLMRIPEAGGTPTPVTQLGAGEIAHRWPQILPGGKAVLFTAAAVGAIFDGATIDVFEPGNSRRKTLWRGGSFGRYLPSGHLTFVNQGTLFAVPFDLEKLEIRGTPVPVLQEVVYSRSNGGAQLDFSSSSTGGGTLIYQKGGVTGSGQRTIQWLDSSGRTQPLLAAADEYLYPRVSPDGKKLAVSTTDIWIYDWERDTRTKLTFNGGVSPVWSP